MFLSYYKRLTTQSLYRESFFIFISTIIAGFVNYLFNPVMARLLGPAQYGELVSILALTMIITVPVGTFSLVIAKYVSLLASSNEKEKIGYLIHLFFKKVFLFSIFLFLLYLPFLPLLKKFFNLTTYRSLLATGILLTISFFLPVSKGVLQGLKRFRFISLLNILEAISKLIFSVGAVLISFKVGGIILAMSIGSLILFVITYRFLNLNKKEVTFKIDIKKEIIKYTKLVFLANFILMLFLNLDILVVKHYFSPDIAGHFSAISLLGKVIFFLGGSFSFVFFPIASEVHSQKNSVTPLLKKVLRINFIISLFIIIIYFLASKFIILILFGQDYLSLSSILWLSGVIFGLYSFINIFVTYYLAVQKKQFFYPLTVGFIMLIILIYFRHNSLIAILNSFILTFSLILVILIITLYFEKKRKII